MSQYTVGIGENIYDVALKLYGSIEGIVDLLASNKVTMETRLEKGMVLEYHEVPINQDIVKWLADNEIAVKNSESGVAALNEGSPHIIVRQSGQFSSIVVKVAEGASLLVEWGDGVCSSVNDNKETIVEHNYADSGEHIIRIYGHNFELLDFTDLNGVYYALDAIHAETFISKIEEEDLNTLFAT